MQRKKERRVDKKRAWERRGEQRIVKVPADNHIKNTATHCLSALKNNM